jgi:hypothetical protein
VKVYREQMARELAKLERLEEMRRREEDRGVKECTFRPKVNKSKTPSRGLKATPR